MVDVHDRWWNVIEIGNLLLTVYQSTKKENRIRSEEEIRKKKCSNSFNHWIKMSLEEDMM